MSFSHFNRNIVRGSMVIASIINIQMNCAHDGHIVSAYFCFCSQSCCILLNRCKHRLFCHILSFTRFYLGDVNVFVIELPKVCIHRNCNVKQKKQMRQKRNWKSCFFFSHHLKMPIYWLYTMTSLCTTSNFDVTMKPRFLFIICVINLMSHRFRLMFRLLLLW